MKKDREFFILVSNIVLSCNQMQYEHLLERGGTPSTKKRYDRQNKLLHEKLCLAKKFGFDNYEEFITMLNDSNRKKRLGIRIEEDIRGTQYIVRLNGERLKL